MKQVSAPRTPVLARLVFVAMCAATLGGCSTVKGWFGGDDKEQPLEPAALTEFAPTIQVARAWTARAGKGEGSMGAAQAPAIAEGRVYAAAVEGGVRAFDLQSGATIWHHASDLPLSGGPGAGDGLVVAGSLEGDVVALDAATGAERWKAKVGNEVIAAPAIGQGMVLVRSNDGRVTAFDAASGERRWFWNHELPALTVRGNDAPVLGPGLVFVGNDDGTLSALSLADGRPLWDQVVGQAEGRTELDRMADVDGAPVIDGIMLFASSYKGQTVGVDGPNGRVAWVRDAGGPGRVGVSPAHVVVTRVDGSVVGLDKASGNVMWTQAALARRGVTGVAVQGEHAVVGDFDGYLHWLRLDDGALAARTRVGRSGLRAAPVVVDGILVAQDVEGGLSAYRIGE